MLQRKQIILAGLLGALCIISIVILFLLPGNDRLSLDRLNQQLKVAEIKMGMLEEEVIAFWGMGEFIHGFGGHGREYQEQGVRISFPGDADNDLYGRVGGLELLKSDYSIFGIHVGEEREQAIHKLVANGFKESEFSDNIYEQGEFMIGLHGEQLIEFIQVWFDDKDLKDRVY